MNPCPLRRTPLAAMSANRLAELTAAGFRPTSTLTRSRAATKTKRRTATPDALKAGLRERSGGWCEIALPGCQGRGVDTSHRKGTQRGGRHGEAAVRHHVLSNALHGCRGCHEHLHANPAWAEAHGLMCEEWQNPAETPVLYRGRLSLLSDNGTVTAVAVGRAA